MRLQKGQKIMVDMSELGYIDMGISRRSIVSINRDGIPSIKMKCRQIQIPLGCIRRVITKAKCIETPFGLDYYTANNNRW